MFTSLISSPFGQSVFWTVVLFVALALLWLLARALLKLGAFAHAAADKAQIEGRSALHVMLLRSADALATCAANAVLTVEQTMRPKIIGAAGSGTLDASQAKALKDAAVALALEQSKFIFGAALQQLGPGDFNGLKPAIEHLVENAAQKIAGNSRAVGTVPASQQTVETTARPPAPASA